MTILTSTTSSYLCTLLDDFRDHVHPNGMNKTEVTVNLNTDPENQITSDRKSNVYKKKKCLINKSLPADWQGKANSWLCIFTFYRQSSGPSILGNCTSLVCEPALSASAPSPSSSCHAQRWLCTTSATAAFPAGWTAAWNASTESKVKNENRRATSTKKDSHTWVPFSEAGQKAVIHQHTFSWILN